MTRCMNRSQIERLVMAANGDSPECQSDTPKGGPVRANAESGRSVSICLSDGWLDRIQVGFPWANWW